MYLGRPWRVDAHIVFINCELGVHLKHVGYFDWNKVEVPEHTRYKAIACTGEGLTHRATWVPWSQVYDPHDDAPQYSKKRVLQDWDI